MISNAAEAAAVVGFGIVLLFTNLRSCFNQWAQGVDVEIGFDALHDGGHAFQAHAGVDVFARQWTQIVGRIADAIELGEDQVPNFDFATVGRADENFAARATDAVGAFAGSAGGPEVIVFTHALKAVGGNFDFVVPNVVGFVVIEINGDSKLFGRDTHPFFSGQEFPGPVDGFALEIVAKAEVAQHFEKRVVVGGTADVVDVAGAEALLAGGGAGEFELALAQEVVFELVHAGGREENRRIPARHEDVAGAACAALRFKEG